MPDYTTMSVEDLNNELKNPSLLTQDRSDIIYAIAKKKANINKVPEDKAAVAPVAITKAAK